MMNRIVIFLLLLISCKTENTNDQAKEVVRKNETVERKKTAPPLVSAASSNERFRNVTVEKISDDTFRVKGEGQIFEANFSWVVEDGHKELKNGNVMTNAGAPEWGQFDFTLNAAKDRENSTLTLILFEISAKDGSRQHELPIKLP